MPSWKNKVRRANDRAFDREMQVKEQERREMQRKISQANFKLKLPDRPDEFLSADLNEEEAEEVLKAFLTLGLEYTLITKT